MNGWLVAMTAVFSFSAVTMGSAQAAVPAWQEPGFVMEEVAVTAVMPVWQEPGFVMEEVVATATAEDVANAWRERAHRRARILVAHLARGDLSE